MSIVYIEDKMIDFVLYIILWYLIRILGCCIIFKCKLGSTEGELDSILILGAFGPIIWAIILLEWHNYFGKR